jgi:hypothetical protein
MGEGDESCPDCAAGRPCARLEQLERNRILAEQWARRVSEGRIRGWVMALRLIIDAQRLQISEDQCSRIDGCTDVGLLKTWVTRAVEARSVDEIIG